MKDTNNDVKTEPNKTSSAGIQKSDVKTPPADPNLIVPKHPKKDVPVVIPIENHTVCHTCKSVIDKTCPYTYKCEWHQCAHVMCQRHDEETGHPECYGMYGRNATVLCSDCSVFADQV